MDDLVIGSNSFVINPIYALSITAGFVLVFLFPLTKDFTSAREKSQYYYLQLITILGAVVGAKFAVVMGDALWPIRPFSDWSALMYSGRSIVGALLFGFLAAEVAKPLMGYKRPPNDRFAIVLPFSIAVGRIGCMFAGCCLGLPIGGRHAENITAPLSLHPIPLYEMAFHLSIGTILVLLYRQKRFQGQLFAIFMIAYGAFRFASENLRVTEKAFYGLSAYQWFAAALILAGMVSYSLRRTNHQQEVVYGA
ncbi:MAG: prolipoprotein diacylglyceryl transferase [Woeseiaceae bacterium]